MAGQPRQAALDAGKKPLGLIGNAVMPASSFGMFTKEPKRACFLRRLEAGDFT
jgi:hypothetical protein